MKRLDLDAVRRELERPDISPEDKRWIEEQTQAYLDILEANPLEAFAPHSKGQREFFEADTKIVAAFAGNRFGKTTALITRLLIQHAPDEMLPRHLKPYKRVRLGFPTMGRLLVPSEQAFEEYTMPTIKQWCPRDLFRGGNWDKAFSKSHNVLHFREGCGQLGIYTYKQDPSVMVGAALDYVAYDEPPPEGHRKECIPRLIDRDGWEMFALTPVNMQGGGIGWLYRKIWKKREAPNITVVRGSSYDNPTLPKKAIDAALAEYDDDERLAREKGEFVHLGGMVYDGGFEDYLVDPPTVRHVRSWDTVVGMDPGLRNAAFIWIGFDSDQRAIVYDEVLLQNKTPADYQLAVAMTNAKWELGWREEREQAIETLGLKLEVGEIQQEEHDSKVRFLKEQRLGERPVYVIDPSARNRSLTNRESVESELQKIGLVAIPGQNDVQAGVQQIRRRAQHGMWLVSRDCRGLRGEAEEYRLEDRPDGEFKVVKENDHRLDAGRYGAMQRSWLPSHDEKARDKLGYTQDFQPPYGVEQEHYESENSPPLGALS